MIGGEIPADSADEAEAVGFAVAGDFLGDPHDRFADAEGLHEERVEADDVAGQTDPEQVAVEAFDLQHDRADVLGAGGEAGGRRRFRPTARRRRCGRNGNPADAFRGHRDVVVAENRFGELLDAAVGHEPAVLAAADRFAVDVEAEMGGFVEGGMEGTERHDGDPRAVRRNQTSDPGRTRRARSRGGRPCGAGGRLRASRRGG